jgi:hypothetical protein
VNNGFSAGLRYESYENPLLGFDQNWKGSGVGYRFAKFTNEKITVTVGNFYDQFGNGLIFRSYEERQLGIDNAMDGIHVLLTPIKGLQVKGFIGEQREFFKKGTGVVRGVDGELQLNDLIPTWVDHKLRLTLGGSFVSRYQKDDSPSKILPPNVGASAGRITVGYGKFSFNGEYAYKINDPSYDNDYIYKPGQAIYTNFSFAKKGFGARLSSKWIDNMSFRSERGASLTNLTLDYLPAISKTYTYRLSTLYPYSTQPNGESGYAGEVYFKLKSGSLLGGHYGTTVSVNGSVVNNIKTTTASDVHLGYESTPFSMSKDVYYQDCAFEINRKFSSHTKVILSYIYQVYNKDKIEGKVDLPNVTAHTVVVDITQKLTDLKSLRFEMQHLSTLEDKGNWAMLLTEYTIAPAWSFFASDEYNYGNTNSDQRFHYYSGGFAYTQGPTRIGLSYARQRGGLLCVGGICRQVYASNGFNINITSRF